jgi:acyl phosphate:glycerol-3-phosphate acyltransferase
MGILEFTFITGLAFLIGSVPFGVLLAKKFGLPDPRTLGSGNIGATNMLRTGRKDIAALTLLLDGLKGVFAVLIASAIAPQAALIAMLAATLGHVFSPWLKFKGGKGVATYLGALLATHVVTGFIVCVLWLLTFYALRISSLAAMVALMLSPFILGWAKGPEAAVAALLTVCLVMYRHRENIKRLMRGSEPKFELHSKKNDEENHG